jgi:hypothetical protein
MSNWEKRKSTSHPSREYYLNTNTKVSQWGIPEGEIPLPPDWERHRSRQFNKIYYENVKTSKTQWEPPFGRILPFILFGDDPDPYHVLDNLDSNWKYGIFITPIFTDEVYIKKFIQDPHPWGELNIPCTQFTSMNSEKAKVCLKKLMSIDNPEVKSLGIEVRQRVNNGLVTDYKPSPIVNKLFDYFSDNFIVGNKYEMIIDHGKDIYEYLGREDCKIIEEDGRTSISYSDSDIQEFEIPNIKHEECHMFKHPYNDLKIIVSDAIKLGKFKMHVPPIDYLSGLSNIDKEDIQKIEQSSINTLKKLFFATYYTSYININKQKITDYLFLIKSKHAYSLHYHISEGNTYIDDSFINEKSEMILDLLQDFSNFPKADSDFYVFRGGKVNGVSGDAYRSEQITSGEIIEEKMFGTISTTILSSFANNWIGKKEKCCIYVIKVPKNENYLIIPDVFIQNNDELELNNKSEYEVTLAPGKLTFTDIKKITIDGYEKALFFCDYKSFTEKEFRDGFKGPIYKYNPKRQEPQEIEIDVLQIEQEEADFLRMKPILKYNVYPRFGDKYDKKCEYALKELKNTEWEYSFVARLDENEKNTRSLIFISKTVGIRGYVNKIFNYSSEYNEEEDSNDED